MRILVWLIALFALAVGVTLFAQVNTGYALLFVPPWRVEISLNVFILLVLITVAVIYAVTRLVRELGGLPVRVKRYRERQAQDASIKLERESRIAFHEGRYQRAERLAGEAFAASRNHEAIAVNGLLAARAAHAMRDFGKRDRYFADLKQKLSPQHLALAMTMAELYLDERRYADADAAIAEARAVSPKLTAAMRLELRLRQREDNPQAILRLCEQLAKTDALDAAQAARIRAQALLSLLASHALAGRELKNWWAKLSAEDKALPQITTAVVDQFAEQGAPTEARSVIEDALGKRWSSELVERYGRLDLPAEDRVGQLQQAEAWLTSHPEDSQLLLTLGRLCRARGLWGKAQNYLEACLAVEKTAVVHAELAELLERLDRHDDAARHYRAALDLALAR
ncbi:MULTISPECIES: heme biosynthesis HemY N-terminal domain-containing protein [Silvimonas]|uniref:heme biosynthesis HemY N-terminal domain-containing protein n=1 Tax=Silvimonas TaxID=300264 RepID=UPI0024B379E6|nr:MULTISPECIES: heme biosynthesis HemY N-terminal domain-containing protein [Silvimonas]MDR3429761.1 heme biosynthesis HemY N-terminal domain-containing protein [Silvimonas sp.]